MAITTPTPTTAHDTTRAGAQQAHLPGAPSSLSSRRSWAIAVAVAMAAAMTLTPATASHASTFTVTTTADSGPGSLRQALDDANAVAGEHTITFDIPGEGPHTITPLSALPAVGAGAAEATVSIDGCTQSGAICSLESALSLQVRIDGPFAGLRLAYMPAGPTIRGLSITGASTAIAGGRTFESGGGVYYGPDDLTVEFNLIGLAPDGTAAGNTTGIRCRDTFASADGPPNIRIAHNVIGGNTSVGISCANGFPFSSPGVFTGLVIEGNIVGLDPSGTSPRPNGVGMSVGSTVGARVIGNVVASNTGNGIDIRYGNVDLLVQENDVSGNGGNGMLFFSGTGFLAFSGPVAVLGNSVHGNTQSGILASPSVTDITIGGVIPWQANTIAGNGGAGVAVGENTSDTSSAVRIRGNAIWDNGGLGIDLARDGVTENAAAAETPRTGPNLLLNHPVITTVQRGSTRVIGSYVGSADQAYTLDFYANSDADPSGYGEGQQWIGSGEVVTDASGQASFDFTFDPTIDTGAVVSATATDSAGNTSEFSPVVTVGPIARDDSASTSLDRVVTIPVLDTDTPGDAALAPESLRLIDPGTGAEVTTATVAEGTFTAEPDGTVTFAPLAGHLGAVTPVQYVVWDANGARSNIAAITVIVGFRPISAADDDFAVMSGGGDAGNVLENDTLDGMPATDDRVTLTMLDDDGSRATIARDGRLVVPAGLAPGVYAIDYRICEIEYPDNCSSATARVTVTAPATTPSDPATPTSAGLASTGFDQGPLLLVAIMMLVGIAALATGRTTRRHRERS